MLGESPLKWMCGEISASCVTVVIALPKIVSELSEIIPALEHQGSNVQAGIRLSASALMGIPGKSLCD